MLSRVSLIALAVLVAVPSPGRCQDASPTVRVLQVKAVADETFRERDDWEREIREHVAWADEKMRELTAVGFELVAVEPWTTHGGSSMTLLLSELRAGVPKDGADAVFGFTGHPPPATMSLLPGGMVTYPLPFTAGIAFPLGDRVVIRRTEMSTLTRHTLIHEVAHLFGGLHVDDRSILETDTNRMSFRLDPFNERVLALTRSRDFDVDVRQMPRGEIAALVDLYGEAPLREKNDPDTAIRIAYLHLLVDQVEEALEEFERAVDIAPERTRDILRSAIIPELEAWARRREPSVQNRYLLAQAHFLAENWSEASALLLPNCDEPHDDAASCALLGAVYLKSGRPDLAKRTLRVALQRDDSSATAYSTLASVLAAERRYDEAIEMFGRALELEPEDVDTHFNTGLAYLAAEKPGAAEASFREVVRLREARDLGRSKLALALARQGRSKEALELVEPFEERRFLSGHVLRDMAEIHFLSGDSTRAFDHLQLAKKGGVDVAEVETLFAAGEWTPRPVEAADLVDQAEAYFRTGRLATARELLVRAEKQRPDEGVIQYWLGRLAAGEKNEEGARDRFQRALELDPDFHRASYELGRLAYGDEDYSRAASLLEPYTDDSEAGSASHFMLGRSQFELGHLEEAEQHLRTAIRKRANDGNAFYFLARVLLEQGRDGEARRELELAIDSRTLPDWRREDAHLRLARLFDAAGESGEAQQHVGAALALRAGEMTTPGHDLAPSATDRIEVVRVAPSLARALPRGEDVRIAFTVRFDLGSAETGIVLLAPQDAAGTPLVRPQPRATVRRGRGEVTLEAIITPPPAGDFVDVFLALHAGGRRNSTAVTRARFALE